MGLLSPSAMLPTPPEMLFPKPMPAVLNEPLPTPPAPVPERDSGAPGVEAGGLPGVEETARAAAVVCGAPELLREMFCTGTAGAGSAAVVGMVGTFIGEPAALRSARSERAGGGFTGLGPAEDVEVF